ncbi:hypothetical protein [Flaviflagellibacter deserti]|jgi:hypothetical protein|uniref:Uncharacterized protein n=1 Tax=Flaviflagellibacter deserti TaxID=2267266 RepID=A0ABV9YVW7_9HYPH
MQTESSAFVADGAATHIQEAQYCNLQARHFAELAEGAKTSDESSYYRNLEELWRWRAVRQMMVSAD